MLAYPQARNALFKKHALAISLSFLFYPAAWAAPSSNALPVLGNIASGTADVTRNISQGKLTVNQQTDKLIANWNSFNVGENAQVIFNQPSSNSIALNRIGSTAASQIFGQVTANGKLILVNPNGLTIGSTGQISAGSVIASTLSISDSDFNANNLHFERGTTTNGINNQGSIQSNNGSTSLLAPSIKNTGTLSASNGNVNLANGNWLNTDGNLVTLAQASSIPSLIQTSGTLQVARIDNSHGRIYILGDRYRTGSKVELAGTINAVSSGIKGKQINITAQLDSPRSLVLDATDSIHINGTVNISNANQLFSLTHGTGAGDTYALSDTGKINLGGSNTRFKLNGEYYTVIRNINQLQAIGTNSTSLVGKYVLAGDIDASATAGWDAGKGFKPIGGDLPHNTTSPLFYFTGVFDGLGHSINQLTIKRGSQDYIGLFGATRNASINNVHLNNVDIYADTYVGALVGYHQALKGTSSIQNNYVSGTVSGRSNTSLQPRATPGGIGGLIGHTNISNATVNFNRNSSTATVSGSLFVSGLLGSSIISNHGNLNIQDNHIAGTVQAVSISGGLLASNLISGDAHLSLKNNRVSASVNSFNMLGEDFPGQFGGLMGRNQVGDDITAATVSIENNHVSGDVNAEDPNAGGIIGYNIVTTPGIVNLTGNQVSGHVNGGSITSISAYTGDKGGLIGTNFVGGKMSISNNLVSGNVTSADDNTGGLIGHNFVSNKAILNISNSRVTANVTGHDKVGGLIGLNWVQFNGKLNISRSSASGVISGQNNIGGLLGLLHLEFGTATIQKSFADGDVNATERSAGGLIGASELKHGSLLLANSYSSAKVTLERPGYNIGGLIGESSAAESSKTRIYNSYVNGAMSVRPFSYSGGLIGFNRGGILQIDNSFWDKESTGAPVSIGGNSIGTVNPANSGTGLSSAQMKQLSTYTGWSINSNPAGSSIWYINDGITPPTLR